MTRPGLIVSASPPTTDKQTVFATLSDLDPPNGYKISGQGDGGVAGFAKGGADVKLTDKPALYS